MQFCQERGDKMTKPKHIICAIMFGVMLSITPVSAFAGSQTVTCQAVTYDEVKSKVIGIGDGAKRFWDDSAQDRAKMSKKAKKKWQKLQKKIAKQHKKAKKQGKKGLKKFKKWRKKQEGEFWDWYKKKLNQ